MDVVQVQVAFVHYRPQMGQRTSVQVEEVVEMDAEELQKREDAKQFDKFFIGPLAYNHYMWYSKAIKMELSAIGPERKLRVTHLRVQSGIRDGFMIKNNLCHTFTIIVGAIEEHFYFVDAITSRTRCARRYRPHLEALARSSVLSGSTYKKCPPEFCANNCIPCRTSTQTFCHCNGKSFANNSSRIEN